MSTAHWYRLIIAVCVFFSKLRFSIFPLEQVEPSKLSNNYETPYSDFRLGREGFNHTSCSNYEDRVEALLGNEERVFSGIPSIEKKISEKVRKFLSFKLFDLFWYTLYIKSPITNSWHRRTASILLIFLSCRRVRTSYNTSYKLTIVITML